MNDTLAAILRLLTSALSVVAIIPTFVSFGCMPGALKNSLAAILRLLTSVLVVVEVVVPLVLLGYMPGGLHPCLEGSQSDEGSR